MNNYQKYKLYLFQDNTAHDTTTLDINSKLISDVNKIYLPTLIEKQLNTLFDQDIVAISSILWHNSYIIKDYVSTVKYIYSTLKIDNIQDIDTCFDAKNLIRASILIDLSYSEVYVFANDQLNTPNVSLNIQQQLLSSLQDYFQIQNIQNAKSLQSSQPSQQSETSNNSLYNEIRTFMKPNGFWALLLSNTNQSNNTNKTSISQILFGFIHFYPLNDYKYILDKIYVNPIRRGYRLINLLIHQIEQYTNYAELIIKIPNEFGANETHNNIFSLPMKNVCQRNHFLLASSNSKNGNQYNHIYDYHTLLFNKYNYSTLFNNYPNQKQILTQFTYNVMQASKRGLVCKATRIQDNKVFILKLLPREKDTTDQDRTVPLVIQNYTSQFNMAPKILFSTILPFTEYRHFLLPLINSNIDLTKIPVSSDYIVYIMQYIEGTLLHHLIHNHSRNLNTSIDEHSVFLSKFESPLKNFIQQLHNMNIIHMDLHSENIFLLTKDNHNSKPRFILIDFDSSIYINETYDPIEINRLKEEEINELLNELNPSLSVVTISALDNQFKQQYSQQIINLHNKMVAIEFEKQSTNLVNSFNNNNNNTNISFNNNNTKYKLYIDKGFITIDPMEPVESNVIGYILYSISDNNIVREALSATSPHQFKVKIYELVVAPEHDDENHEYRLQLLNQVLEKYVDTDTKVYDIRFEIPEWLTDQSLFGSFLKKNKFFPSIINPHIYKYKARQQGYDPSFDMYKNGIQYLKEYYALKYKEWTIASSSASEVDHIKQQYQEWIKTKMYRQYFKYNPKVNVNTNLNINNNDNIIDLTNSLEPNSNPNTMNDDNNNNNNPNIRHDLEQNLDISFNVSSFTENENILYAELLKLVIECCNRISNNPISKQICEEIIDINTFQDKSVIVPLPIQIKHGYINIDQYKDGYFVKPSIYKQRKVYKNDPLKPIHTWLQLGESIIIDPCLYKFELDIHDLIDHGIYKFSYPSMHSIHKHLQGKLYQDDVTMISNTAFISIHIDSKFNQRYHELKGNVRDYETIPNYTNIDNDNNNNETSDSDENDDPTEIRLYQKKSRTINNQSTKGSGNDSGLESLLDFDQNQELDQDINQDMNINNNNNNNINPNNNPNTNSRMNPIVQQIIDSTNNNANQNTRNFPYYNIFDNSTLDPTALSQLLSSRYELPPAIPYTYESFIEKIQVFGQDSKEIACRFVNIPLQLMERKER